MNTVHVSGLPESVTGDDLKQLFTPFGRVLSARVLGDLEGESLGCGIVEMSCKQEVDEILSTKDRISVSGKRPHIWVAKDKRKPAPKIIEVLIRWRCYCSTPRLCSSCNGTGYQERWVNTDVLHHLGGLHFIIQERRYVSL